MTQALEDQTVPLEASCHDRRTYHSYTHRGWGGHSRLLPTCIQTRRLLEEVSEDLSLAHDASAEEIRHVLEVAVLHSTDLIARPRFDQLFASATLSYALLDIRSPFVLPEPASQDSPAPEGWRTGA